jgi:hypothetical protein
VERNTHFNKRNQETQIHQRNQDYSHPKFSDNEVSVVLSFRASPNAFAPSSPIILPTKTHPSGEIQIRIQQNSSNGRRCQQAIATIAASALDIWGYWSCLFTTHFDQSNQRYTHFNKKKPGSTSHQRNQDSVKQRDHDQKAAMRHSSRKTVPTHFDS